MGPSCKMFQPNETDDNEIDAQFFCRYVKGVPFDLEGI